MPLSIRLSLSHSLPLPLYLPCSSHACLITSLPVYPVYSSSLARSHTHSLPFSSALRPARRPCLLHCFGPGVQGARGPAALWINTGRTVLPFPPAPPPTTPHHPMGAACFPLLRVDLRGHFKPFIRDSQIVMLLDIRWVLSAQTKQHSVQPKTNLFQCTGRGAEGLHGMPQKNKKSQGIPEWKPSWLLNMVTS